MSRAALHQPLLLLVSVLLPSLACARSPEETLTAYVRAVQQRGLPAVVEFIHPDELAAPKDRKGRWK